MAPKKTIQINPDFLRPRTKRGSRKQKRKKPDGVASLKPNNIKKKLMQRIKDFQSREKEKAKEPESTFQRDFKSSLDFLQGVVRKKKEKKQRRRRTRRRNAGGEQPVAQVKTEAAVEARPKATEPKVQVPQAKAEVARPPPPPPPPPPGAPAKPPTGSASRPAPPYSNLKGGTKPTYSEYSKTLKKGNEPGKVTIHAPAAPEPSSTAKARQQKLEKARNSYAQVAPRASKRHARRKKRRTIKIFRLGKSGGNVGVLIKCKATRKRVQKECDRLKKTSVIDIKKYLRRHNLIKAGSTAPEDVLRKLYEDSRLSGDVYNRNADYLLHNFLSTEV